MTAIFRKELWTFFGNWSAWLIAAAFSIISALFLFFFENDANIFDTGTATLQSYFTLAPWLFLLIIPALSMRTFAEEQQNGTLQWLFAQPLTVWQLIWGKYLAVMVMVVLCLLPSAIILYTVWNLGLPSGNLDTGALAGSYIGIVLLAGAYAAVGVCASALSANQIAAFLLGLLFCFLLYFGLEQLASYRLLGDADYLLGNLGFYQHFLAFTRGLVDTRDVAYFLLVILLFLFLAKTIVEKKK